MRKKLKMSGSLESLQAIGQLYFEPYRRVIFSFFFGNVYYSSFSI